MEYPDPADQWNLIDWQIVNTKVHEMQTTIAQAVSPGGLSDILAAQDILTHSYPAKLLAVRIITMSKGARTAGIDHEHWTNPEQKIEAVSRLNIGPYQAKPARRIHIPKPGSSQKRPISILTMFDRAMQALYGLALRPVSETTGDPHSYGYRLNRSAPDAIRYLSDGIFEPHPLPWILKGDIHQCFDQISHDWLLDHIPIQRPVLTQFLSCGYIEGWQFIQSEEGVMQGGYISPILANMALDGAESLLLSKYSADEFRLVRYADDLVVATGTKRTAEEIYDLLQDFIGERGLHFSKQKTDILHLSKGFEYLGVTIRSSLHHLTIRPADRSVQAILTSIQQIISKGMIWDQDKLIKTLNPMILGWARYHRYLPTSALDIRMDAAVRLMLRRWAEFRHPNQSPEWITGEYWRSDPNHGERFASKTSCLASFKAEPIKNWELPNGKNPFLTEIEKPKMKTGDRLHHGYGIYHPYLSSSPYPPAPWLNMN